MTKDELTNWALANGWQSIADHLSLTKPSRPSEAIVRLVLKGTVVNLEIKKPAGKWEKVASAPMPRSKPTRRPVSPEGWGWTRSPDSRC